ncbi:hypothetical protein DFH08DRAFT_827999 [Mycena albidolilacea]|uniref:Uncharacterized protein n=1 Tax=Mycena albidolilacea TaxID=1033008 RepID=A0AAD6YX29_9AGAR|nr:hypothetical protein DFH08DRAFT_827999 [Mycena albidolilacea]
MNSGGGSGEHSRHMGKAVEEEGDDLPCTVSYLFGDSPSRHGRLVCTRPVSPPLRPLPALPLPARNLTAARGTRACASAVSALCRRESMLQADTLMSMVVVVTLVAMVVKEFMSLTVFGSGVLGMRNQASLNSNNADIESKLKCTCLLRDMSMARRVGATGGPAHADDHCSHSNVEAASRSTRMKETDMDEEVLVHSFDAPRGAAAQRHGDEANGLQNVQLPLVVLDSELPHARDETRHGAKTLRLHCTFWIGVAPGKVYVRVRGRIEWCRSGNELKATRIAEVERAKAQVDGTEKTIRNKVHQWRAMNDN